MDKRRKKEMNFWRYYTRDDGYVKEKFLKKDFDTIETTGFGNFDGLFSLFNFRPSCRKRVMIPLVYLLSTYSLKVILRISSLNRTCCVK